MPLQNSSFTLKLTLPLRVKSVVVVMPQTPQWGLVQTHRVKVGDNWLEVGDLVQHHKSGSVARIWAIDMYPHGEDQQMTWMCLLMRADGEFKWRRLAPWVPLKI